MKSILNSKTEDTKLIVLVKRNKNKKYRVKFRFYKLEKDGVTELTSKVAPSLGRNLTKRGYIEIENAFKENIDFANAAYWILKDYVNITGSDKEILKYPRYYVEA